MVCRSFCCAFLLVILAIQTCPTTSQAIVCQNPPDPEGNEFLRIHNVISSAVRPRAANMNLYSWDPVLSMLAATIAYNCIEENSIPFNVYSNGIGINTLYWPAPSTAGPKRVTDIVQFWANEENDYNYETNTCANGTRCDNYKQIVWAKTKYLGCAISPNPCDTERRFLAVCLYSPKGDNNNEKPYIKGTPCTQCEPGYQSCIERLCAPTR